MAIEESDVMMLKAMTDPSGMRDSIEMMTKVRRTEFQGICVAGETLSS